MPERLAHPQRMTIQEYLSFDEASEEKYEYVDGWVVPIGFDPGNPMAMAGGSPLHSRLTARVARMIGTRLAGTACEVYDSNLKVRATGRSRYRYPDAAIICGEPEFDHADPKNQAVTNVRLVVEVLSDSTELIDRGEKFTDYRAGPAFEEYVLVSQYAPRVETFFRQPDGAWTFHVFEGLTGVTRLRSVGIELPHAELFAGIRFDPEPFSENWRPSEPRPPSGAV